ncbi:hypothetical protein BD309DRAFT_570903 [Dichomitus squalens]|nr:hypothetical protein BD309DRAFT_570903 [Dichomitus squalens]
MSIFLAAPRASVESIYPYSSGQDSGLSNEQHVRSTDSQGCNRIAKKMDIAQVEVQLPLPRSWDPYVMQEVELVDGGCAEGSALSGSSQDTTTWSKDGQLLVQIDRDVYLFLRDQADIDAAVRAFARGILGFRHVHVEVHCPRTLRTFCDALAREAFAPQVINKFRSLKLVLSTSLRSTPDDVSVAFRSLTDLKHAQLLLPAFHRRGLCLPHKQPIGSLTTESFTIRSLRGPAPPLVNLSVNTTLEDEKALCASINRLFEHSLVRLRILRQYEPCAKHTGPSPARTCFLLYLPHLVYLELRDTALLRDSGLGQVDLISQAPWIHYAPRNLPKLKLLLWAPPWHQYLEYAPRIYAQSIAAYQEDLSLVLRPVHLVMCESQTEGFLSYPLPDGTYRHGRESSVYVDEDGWRR